MKEFLMENMLIVIALIVFVVVMIMLYRAGHRERVKQIILSLVVQAEKALGSGTGELKYALVVERLYYVMPPMLRFLYTKKEIDQYIYDAVEWLKKYLEEGHDLLGYENELLIDCSIDLQEDMSVIKQE